MGKTNFETFTDGVCSIYVLDEARRPVLKCAGLRFRQRTVGSKRAADAEQNGHTIQMLIRVPIASFNAEGCFVVIGAQQFRVMQAQGIYDTLPRCTDLTLEQPTVLLDFDACEVGAGGRV